jgi:hypothetical protein
MASFSEIDEHYKIRFYSSRHSPAEKALYLSKENWKKREVRKRKRELVVAYDKGEYDPWTDPLPKRQGSGELRLRGALDEYLAHKRKLGERDQQGGWNAQTHRRYRSNLHAFARQTGERRRVTDLTTEDFESWIFRTSLSEATQRMYRRQLNTFVRWLREKKEVEVADLPKPFRAERRTIDDFPTEEDLRAVCRAHRQNCIEGAQKARSSDRPEERAPQVAIHDGISPRLLPGLAAQGSRASQARYR